MDQHEWAELTSEQQRAHYLDTWSRAAMAELGMADLKADLHRVKIERDAAEDAVVSYVKPCPHCHEHLADDDECTCLDAFDKIVGVLDRWSSEHGEPLA